MKYLTIRSDIGSLCYDPIFLFLDRIGIILKKSEKVRSDRLVFVEDDLEVMGEDLRLILGLMEDD